MKFEIIALCCSLGGVAEAFAQSLVPNNRQSNFPRHNVKSSPFALKRRLSQIRGGQQDRSTVAKSTSPTQSLSLTIPTLLAGIGKSYSLSLERRPILTKSVTACIIFGMSDYLAQKLESGYNKQSKISLEYNWLRTLTSIAVGLFYFGPAAHAWYGMIFKLFPGTGLVSTLQKAAMGQIFFGPSFTCIFFATNLWQSGQFTLGNWVQKIRQDLPSAWLAGAGFWPLVDLVSYSFISVQYIPLFVNICSFVWTIYLSIVANRSSSARTD